MKTARTYEELKARLDEMSGKTAEKQADKTAEAKKKAEAYNTAFWETMHTGAIQNALKEGSDGAGGYLVPDTYDDRLVQALESEYVLRKLGTTIKTTQKMHIPIGCGIDSACWIVEGQAAPFGDAKFEEVVIDAHKLAASILASDEMLEDGGIDLEKYIAEMFAQRIGDAEEEAFIRGDGKHKPLGIYHQAQLGKLSDTAGVITVDDLIDLMYSVTKTYRDNAVWVISDDAYCKLRQIEHFNGEPIWFDGMEKGEPHQLLGYPVYVCKHMDFVVPGGIPVMFGDFSYFWIGDRGKRVIKRLVERFADRGQVAFITTERVDAKLILPEAVKMLKVKSDTE